MVDQVLLNDTLQKINASLNKRFEKDADLYISRQDEYEIKKHLCNEAYGAIINMAKAKGISHEIIVKVIMRNAGVLNINAKDTKKLGKFKRELQCIFDDVNYKSLQYIMEDVLSNNIYMPKELRHILFGFYMRGVSSIMRDEYWKRTNLDLDKHERKELFKIIIEKNNFADEKMNLKYKFDFSIISLKKYPSIMNEKKVFINLKKSLPEDEQNTFFTYLCNEIENPSIQDEAYSFIVIGAYESYDAKAFKDAIAKLRGANRAFKQYVRAICKVLRECKDLTEVTDYFDTITRLYDSGYLAPYIKREIERKVWKSANYNKALYQERKDKIDTLLANVENEDKQKYSSYSDILKAIDSPTSAKTAKTIAYFWINMKSPEFENSIADSFLEEAKTRIIKDTYSWIFEHSKAKGHTDVLKKACIRIAVSLHEFRKKGYHSECFNEMERLWLQNVIKYSLKGKEINDYMFTYHHDKVREWQ